MSTPPLDETHDPDVHSFVRSAHHHPDFPIQNLPLGVFSVGDELSSAGRGGVRIGDDVLDLPRLASVGLLTGSALRAARAASAPTLNDLLALGPEPRRELRRQLHGLLAQDTPDRLAVADCLHPVADVQLALPATIGDFTDFYAGIHHARAVGALFRPDHPLLPNYTWVPIGYHGRSSSVAVSPDVVHRPRGQMATPSGIPTYAPTQRLDIELELGIWIGANPAPEQVPPISSAADQIAGYCLLNDWSARDIQAWEYQPLGPFLAKSFATTVSPWIVTPEALAPYRRPVERPVDDPAPLPYLRDPADQAAGGLDVQLEILLRTAAMLRAHESSVTLSRSSTRHLYWTPAQLVAHHASGGLQLRPGDLLGSGTISGPDPGSAGSLLEISGGGTVPIQLPGGETRTFLEDGDEITLRARATRPGVAPIGFGECRAVVVGPRPTGSDHRDGGHGGATAGG
jgi:fumarylacetoacetase